MENFFDGIDDESIFRGLLLLMTAIISLDEKNDTDS